jgi:hypothetical protein
VGTIRTTDPALVTVVVVRDTVGVSVLYAHFGIWVKVFVLRTRNTLVHVELVEQTRSVGWKRTGPKFRVDDIRRVASQTLVLIEMVCLTVFIEVDSCSTVSSRNPFGCGIITIKAFIFITISLIRITSRTGHS